MSFGRDRDGGLYVLTTEKAAVTGSTGKVYKFVGAEEGDGNGTTGETTTEGENS